MVTTDTCGLFSACFPPLLDDGDVVRLRRFTRNRFFLGRRRVIPL